MIILRRRVPGLSERTLGKFVARASSAARLKGAVHVLVSGSRELRSLNRRFRGHDKETDVLSFPPLPELAEGLAGDIAISAEIAARNARHLRHSAADEVRVLALHGILHLAGYDHERDDGEMARKEERLRKVLGLPAGLIQRGDSRSRTQRTGPRRKRKS
ncbi:MAG TPA: rRNA maturation RNase YbeY [Terriglobales bacterium]|nr:rRNA maturation RNase YbeY [Terriglobales bacterium]